MRTPQLGDLVLYRNANGVQVPAIVNLVFDDNSVSLVVFATFSDYRPDRVYEGTETHQWEFAE